MLISTTFKLFNIIWLENSNELTLLYKFVLLVDKYVLSQTIHRLTTCDAYVGQEISKHTPLQPASVNWNYLLCTSEYSRDGGFSFMFNFSHNLGKTQLTVSSSRLFMRISIIYSINVQCLLLFSPVKLLSWI